MRVKLKVNYVAPGGGFCFPGETVNVPENTGKRLIERREAVSAEIERKTKPVTNAPALRGFAKLAFLKNQLKERGVEPCGNTVKVLTEQLQGLDG